jgi:hypothetical protein
MFAFYAAGGALALWAVLVSVLGISRPDFPGSRGAERMVIAISIALVVIAIASGIVSGILESSHEEASVPAAHL